MVDSSDEKDPCDELKNYIQEESEEDPYLTLEKWLDDDGVPEKKKKKTKSKSRFSSVKRNRHGNRVYTFTGKKRYSAKKNSKQDLKTITPPSDTVFDDDHFNTAFEEVDLPEESVKKKRKSWKERMEKIEKLWSEGKDEILNCLKSSLILKDNCHMCMSKSPVISCHECRIEVCEHCDLQIHEKQPLHNRITFVNSLKHLSPMEALNEKLETCTVDRVVPLKRANCVCGSSKFEEIVKEGIIIVITMKGKFDLRPFLLKCCGCHQLKDPFNIENILSSGFWPSSPKNLTCLISEDVFLTWDQFRKHMPGSSLNSFLESLNDLTLYFGRQGKIVPSSFSQTFKQWNFAQYELDMEKGMNWMQCPCCSIKQHACHVDGNAKLYRYRHSGSRRRESYYQESFIAHDKKVDSFISSLQIEKRKNPKTSSDTTCGGEWSAARNTERKRKSVDYTGLYVATCRHQYGLKSLNMKRGEIYAYPAYLLTTYILPHNVEFLFADVMCKLWVYLCKVDPTLTSKLKGALSVMHAKGHNLSCQVDWDGEWLQGSGKSTGEECEQLFSYLSRCANTTKYQTPENREETLTEMVMFWNRRKTLNLAESLLKKYNRVTKEASNFEAKLNNKCLEMKISIKDVDFVSLMNKLKTFARGGLLSPAKPTRHQQMILLEHDLKQVPPNASQDSKDLLQTKMLPDLTNLKLPTLSISKAEKESLLASVWDNEISSSQMAGELDYLKSEILVPAFQNAIQSCRFEMLHWNIKSEKYADSAKLRNACRSKFTESNKKLKSLLERFITVKSSEEVSEFELIKESNHRQLLEWNAKKERCHEEINLLKRDMESYLTFYTTKIVTMSAAVDTSDVFEQASDGGVNTLTKIGIDFSRRQLLKGFACFASIIPLERIQYFKTATGLDEINLQYHGLEEEMEEYGEEEAAVMEIEKEKELGFEIELDLETVNDLGLDLLGYFELDHCTQGENFVILPERFSQGRLNGRNGSNACSVIAVLTGYLFSTLPSKINFRNSVSLFVGCIETGNTLHDENQNLLVHEAVELIPIPLQIFEERNALPKDLPNIIDLLFSNSEIVIVTCNHRSLCLVRSSIDQNIFMFDSHQHDEMGPLIAWTENDIGDIIPRIPFETDDDVIYLCSIKY